MAAAWCSLVDWRLELRVSFCWRRCRATTNPLVPVALVALVGFLLLGPYSYLAGAMSMDFGGEKGAATAAGIIDGVGYLAGVLSGDTMARVTVHYGWRNAFVALAVICLITAAVALILAISQRREAQARLRLGV